MMRAIAAIALVACTSAPSAGGMTDAGGKADGGGKPIEWSVSRHVFTSDTPAAISQDLALLAELGASYVRTDVWWYAIEPVQGQYDQTALDFYRRYVEEAGRHGLGVIVILSNAPDWARSLYSSDRAAFVT